MTDGDIATTGSAAPKQPPPRDWAKFLVENEEQIGRYIDRVAKHLIGGLGESWRHKEVVARAQAKTGFTIILSVFLLLGFGLAFTFYLVLNGRLSGETFVFFIGAMLGSLITFLAERIVPLLYPAEEPLE